MEVQIKSKQGREKFFENGFLYLFDRNSACGAKKFWRCDRKGEGCLVRIHTQDGTIVKSINHHTHDSSAATVEVLKIKTKIKDRATSTMEAPAQIINNVLSYDGKNVPRSVLAALPVQTALKKMIRRQRNEVNRAPPVPRSLEELEIPEKYKTVMGRDNEEEDFLLADSGASLIRILIFGKRDNLKILRESKHWFIDGTFRSAPTLFYQVYVILAEKLGGVHPIIYALLPNKKIGTYKRLLDMLLELEAGLNPQLVSCDFELAAINAFQEKFQGVQMQGCFFHLVKNFKKHLAELNLLGRYQNDPDFAHMAKMITSLAFVPIENLDEALESLTEEIPPDLLPMLDWFEDFYVGRLNRRGGGRRPPMFLPTLWSVYERVINDIHRTNNFAEASHRRLQTELSMDHPTIWSFIDILKKVQVTRDMYIEQLIAGQAPPKKLRKYVECDKRIKNIVENFNNIGMVEYLKGLAYNYNMA